MSCSAFPKTKPKPVLLLPCPFKRMSFLLFSPHTQGLYIYEHMLLKTENLLPLLVFVE